MAIDKKAYATSKVYTNQVALGISSMRVEGNTVYFTIIDTGEEVGVTLPTPADGASITEVDVDENNYLICTLSNGSTVKSTNPINVVIEVVSDGVQADFEQTDSTADDFIKNKPKFKVVTEDDIDELVGVSEGEIEFVLPEEVGQWMTEHEAYAETLNEAIQKNATDIANNASNISEINTTLKNKANSDDVYNKEQVYSKEQTDNVITAKVAEIVAGAPEEFNTLKEMSDWLTEHEDSAATMNTAILKNKADIAANTEAIEENKNDILSAENDIAINRITLGTQSKNLLSVNDGTATRFIDKIINQIELGKYIVSIGELTSTDVDSSICLCLFTDDYNTPLSNNIHLKRGTNVSATVTINESATKIRIYASNDWNNSDGDTVTASNIMLRPADITDSTYEPYKPSVNERLVEVEESVSELTPQVEQNKTDVSNTRGFFYLKQSSIAEKTFTYNPNTLHGHSKNFTGALLVTLYDWSSNLELKENLYLVSWNGGVNYIRVQPILASNTRLSLISVTSENNIITFTANTSSYSITPLHAGTLVTQ